MVLLVKQLAIPLSNQKTVAKWLVIAIRLSEQTTLAKSLVIRASVGSGKNPLPTHYPLPSFARRKFRRTNLRRQLVEHAIDIFVAVSAAKGLGQFNRFVDDDLVGHFEVLR